MGELFDRYEAIGWNCEAAFQLNRIGQPHSGFFAWCISNPDTVAQVVESAFAGVLKPSNFAFNPFTGLVTDKAYGYDFHSPYATKEPGDDPGFVRKYADHRAKTEHLIEKFDEPGRRCFLLVCRNDITLDQARRLRSALRLRHSDFQLVVLRSQVWSDGRADEPQISYRYLERLAPSDAADQGHVPSWDAVFREFSVAGSGADEAVGDRVVLERFHRLA